VTKELFLAALDPSSRIINLVNDRGFTVVSECDYNHLSRTRWYYAARYAFESRNHSGKQLAHFVIDVPEGFEPDHINHEKLDNRRCNLRTATKQQQNGHLLKMVKKPTTSRFKGVYYNWNWGKWIAVIQGKYLGGFDNEDDAAQAYNDAAQIAWGKFAVLNQI